MRTIRLLIAAWAYALSCGCIEAAAQPQPPVLLAIVPEFYDGVAPALRVSLRGDRHFTRPLSTVVSRFEVRSSAGAAVSVEPELSVPAETYRGYEDRRYLLPADLTDGVYTATVEFSDWGVSIGPAASEVIQRDGLEFQTVFSYSQAHFEFESISICAGLVTLVFGERVMPVPPSTFLERVHITSKGQDVECRVAASSLEPAGLVFGSSIELECGTIEAPFSVVLNSLQAATGRAPVVFIPEGHEVGEVWFDLPTRIAGDCMIFNTRKP
ncbi:MAG: hypothetical protein Q8L48_31610 [Archangium sp.]|nr:hypothetical protein [Archangium sp.]